MTPDEITAERERRIQKIMTERGVGRAEAEVIWLRQRNIGGAIIRANEERKEQQEREQNDD